MEMSAVTVTDVCLRSPCIAACMPSFRPHPLPLFLLLATDASHYRQRRSATHRFPPTLAKCPSCPPSALPPFLVHSVHYWPGGSN